MKDKTLKLFKRIVIGFFILIFFMGFFSHSIINLFLPKVKVVAATPTQVEKTLVLQGKVEAKESHEVRLEGSVIIKEFLVEQGDAIEKGTPIFQINTNYGIKGSQDLVEDLRNQLELEKINRENIASLEGQDSQLKLIDKRIDQLQEKINKLVSNNKFYSKVDKEGVYHAEVGGVVMKMNKTNTPLPQDILIVELAKVEKPETYNYVAKFPTDKYDFIKSVGQVELQKEYYDEVTQLDITNIDTIVEDGTMELEANFNDKYPRDIFIGEQLKGKVVMKKKIKGYLSVSKAVLNPIGGFFDDNEAYIYIVEDKKGILGTEYIAKQVKVKMEFVGDHEVIVSGLDRPRLRIISNPSYKIQDGVKVFIWN